MEILEALADLDCPGQSQAIPLMNLRVFSLDDVRGCFVFRVAVVVFDVGVVVVGFPDVFGAVAGGGS